MKKNAKKYANVCVNRKNDKRMKGIKRWAGMLCLTLISAMMLTGCSGKNETTKVDKDGKKLVRVAYFPNVTHAQGIIMKEKGLLEEALGDDYKVSWVAFNAGPAEVEALFAGEIDMGYIGPVPAISANVTSNGEYKIIAGGAKGGEALVARKDLDLTDLSNLKGKKVAVPQKGNTQHLSFLALLDKEKLEVGTGDDQVEIVEAENADILNLLSQGSIDAAMIPEPWVSIISAQEDIVVARDYNEIWQETGNATTVVIANEEYVDNNKEVYEAFLKAHEEVNTFIEENQEEAITLVQKELKDTAGKDIKTEVLQQAFGRITYDTKADEEHIYQFGELSFQEGFINKAPEDLFYSQSK